MIGSPGVNHVDMEATPLTCGSGLLSTPSVQSPGVTVNVQPWTTQLDSMQRADRTQKLIITECNPTCLAPEQTQLEHFVKRLV